MSREACFLFPPGHLFPPSRPRSTDIATPSQHRRNTVLPPMKKAACFSPPCWRETEPPRRLSITLGSLFLVTASLITLAPSCATTPAGWPVRFWPVQAC